MNKIKKLPQTLINKIAAGEVVERPASVVKELIENSIDAGATKITLSVKNGGFNEISIQDNGIGIAEEDLELAFERHATSKISSLEDLNNINSLGFRGEALSSISSIADIEIHTCRSGSNAVLAKIKDGVIESKETKPRSIGTTITIKEIFRYVPARKKFLSSESTEYRHIYNMFLQLALSKPKIEFVLIKDGKQVKGFKKSTLAERISAIAGYGNEEIIEVEAEAPFIKVRGFLGHPSLADVNVKQFMYINERFIQERTIFSAVKEGYSTSIPRDRKPVFFLFFDIDPNKIDVNVHPRKMEARIEKNSNLYPFVKQLVERAIQKSLKSEFVDKVTEPEREFDYTPNLPRTAVSYSNSVKHESTSKPSINQSLRFTAEILKSAPALDVRFAGQLWRTYIIFEKQGSALIVDQHAADERVKFEKITKSIKRGEQIPAQRLLVPFLFEVSSELTDVMESNADTFRNLGLEISKIGRNEFQLASLPEFTKIESIERMIDEIKKDIEGDEQKLNIQAHQNKLISTIACHSSIRAGDPIESSQAIKLLTDLLECESPYSCPHGRPISWEIEKYEISKHFQRNK